MDTPENTHPRSRPTRFLLYLRDVTVSVVVSEILTQLLTRELLTGWISLVPAFLAWIGALA